MKRAGIRLPQPASVEAVAALQAALPPSVPDDYFDFLSRHNGGEVWYDEVDFARDEFDCLRMDTVEEASDQKIRAALSDVFPNLLVIGSDGGGSLLAYDMRQIMPWPIVLHLPGFGTVRRWISMAELERLHFTE